MANLDLKYLQVKVYSRVSLLMTKKKAEYFLGRFGRLRPGNVVIVSRKHPVTYGLEYFDNIYRHVNYIHYSRYKYQKSSFVPVRVKCDAKEEDNDYQLY